MSPTVPSWNDVPSSVWKTHLLPFLGNPGLDFSVSFLQTDTTDPDFADLEWRAPSRSRIRMEPVSASQHSVAAVVVQRSPTGIPTQTERAFVLALLHVYSMLEAGKCLLGKDQVLVLTLAGFRVEVRGYRPLFGMTVGVSNNRDLVKYEALCSCSRRLPLTASTFPLLVRHGPITDTTDAVVSRRLRDTLTELRLPLLRKLRQGCSALVLFDDRYCCLRLRTDMGSSSLFACSSELHRVLSTKDVEPSPQIS